MRLSSRLLSNAFTTFLRQGVTFSIGLFTTWYVLGGAGMVGFSLLALAVSSASLSRALETTFRAGLVREMATAIASGSDSVVRCSLASTLRLCFQTTLPVVGITVLLAVVAFAGFFHTPAERPGLEVALALLILAEGLHAAVRLMSAPFLQSLFAAQMVAVDSLLVIVARSSTAVAAVAVLGWWLPDADLAVQLRGFALTRVTLQLVDVALGIWLAVRRVPGLRLDFSAFDDTEYRSVRSTLWHSSQITVMLNANAQYLAILIHFIFGLAYNGIWQIAVQFAGFARMLFEGLLRGIAPLTTHLLAAGRREAIANLLTRSIRYQLALALPIAIFAGLYVRPLLDLWVGGRMASDPHLAAVGLSAAAAMELTAMLAVILLTTQVLRAGFFGVERILFGIGSIASYAWCAKWALLLALGSAGVAMQVWRHAIFAPLALLVADMFFVTVLLRAARRELGLPLIATLRRSLARPLASGLLFLALLLPIRLWSPHVTLPLLGFAVLFSIGFNSVVAAAWIADAGERRRVREILHEGGLRLLRRSPWRYNPVLSSPIRPADAPPSKESGLP